MGGTATGVVATVGGMTVGSFVAAAALPVGAVGVALLVGRERKAMGMEWMKRR
jgi:hypothetical protein